MRRGVRCRQRRGTVCSPRRFNRRRPHGWPQCGDLFRVRECAVLGSSRLRSVQRVLHGFARFRQGSARLQKFRKILQGTTGSALGDACIANATRHHKAAAEVSARDRALSATSLEWTSISGLRGHPDGDDPDRHRRAFADRHDQRVTAERCHPGGPCARTLGPGRRRGGRLSSSSSRSGAWSWWLAEGAAELMLELSREPPWVGAGGAPSGRGAC